MPREKFKVKRISLIVSHEEFLRWQKAADESYLTMNVWVRMKVNGQMGNNVSPAEETQPHHIRAGQPVNPDPVISEVMSQEQVKAAPVPKQPTLCPLCQSRGPQKGTRPLPDCPYKCAEKWEKAVVA